MIISRAFLSGKERIHNANQAVSLGIIHDPPPGNHPIRIIVKNGNVILEGVVNTAGDRIIAGMRAKTTAGVFSVTNDLVVPDEKTH